MRKDQTLGEYLRLQGISRRGFLKYCSATASLMALPPSAAALVADALATARRPSVIWLSFQECTGCTESLTRSHAPTLESLIFDAISLDYHHTLQAAAGTGAEDARKAAMEENAGKYLLVVDGSIPIGNPAFSTIAGVSNLDMLKETGPSARGSESDRRSFGIRDHHGQTDHQRFGLPADSCRHHGCSCSLPDIRHDSRARRTRPASCLLWPEHS